MAIENLESRAVPAGLGLHPFFTRDADTELAFRAAAVWLGDEEVLPTKRVAVPAEWDYSRSRTVEPGLDNCFEAWDGRAVITWPGRGLKLELQAGQPFRHARGLYPGEPSILLRRAREPRQRQGCRGPARAGATLAGEVAFRVSTL